MKNTTNNKHAEYIIHIYLRNEGFSRGQPSDQTTGDQLRVHSYTNIACYWAQRGSHAKEKENEQQQTKQLVKRILIKNIQP